MKFHVTTKQNTRPNFIDIFLSRTILRIIPAWFTPNRITAIRFGLIPFVIFFITADHGVLALILFLVAALTDALDGARARVDNLITDWGKMYDPFADKLLIGSVAALVVTKYVSPILAYFIISVEMILILHGYYKRNAKGVVIQAVFVGKIKMILQSIGISFLLLSIAGVTFPGLLFFTELILWAALLFGVISLVVYRSI